MTSCILDRIVSALKSPSCVPLPCVFTLSWRVFTFKMFIAACCRTLLFSRLAVSAFSLGVEATRVWLVADVRATSSVLALSQLFCAPFLVSLWLLLDQSDAFSLARLAAPHLSCSLQNL